MELKNRLVMPAMGTRLAGKGGYVTQRMIDYYAERAKGGVGLVMTQFARPTPDSAYPASFAIYGDEHIPGLRELVTGVHQSGARIAVQIGHLGPILIQSESTEGLKIGVPSLLPWMVQKGCFYELTVDDIHRYQEAFAEAARRARDAGCDAVDFHACHGCFVNAFLTPAFNYRTDEYGGSTEKRVRFLSEILSMTRQKVGPDFPLIVRINGADYHEGGTKIEEAVCQAVLLEKAGADAINVTAGLEMWSPMTIPPYNYPKGILAPLAEKVKKSVKVPVIAVGKIDLPLGERLVKEGKADFIAMGRQLLADPHLPNKAREGRPEDIRSCIFCNNCLYTGREGKIRACTVNSFLFRESEYPPRPAAAKKKVMVIGGGLAGMQVSVILKQRGHEVTLYEREDKLGGQWNIASAMKPKEGFATLTARLAKDLAQAEVEVRLNTEVNRDLVSKVKPDAVVLATGAIPQTLNVPGAQGKNVVQANDVIMKRAKVGQRVVVIGGRFLGMEVAASLAEQDKQVALVSRGRISGQKRPLERFTYRILFAQLVKLRVPLYPYCLVIDIQDRGVNIECNEGAFLLEADTVVLAVGAQSQNSLAKEIGGLVPELYQVGDCVQPDDARTATYEATTVALQI